VKQQYRNIILRLSLLLGVIAIATLVIIAKVNRDRTRITGIEVQVDELNDKFFVSAESIKTLVSRHFSFMNKTMSGKILKRIEHTIESLPQIKNASAYIDDNGKLRIDVEQRLPVARVFALNGESFYIDTEGYKFPLSNAFSAKVPVITGNIAESGKKVEKIQTPDLLNAYRVNQALQQEKTWAAMIGQININDKKEIELVPRAGNAIILVGTSEKLETKMKKLAVFYTDVIGREGWDKYKVINIMYKDQVVCLK
jgi:cell division protein FtsQ